MFTRIAPIIALAFLPPISPGQSDTSPRCQLFGGLSYLSNSLNGTPGAHRPMMGWDSGVSAPWYYRLRFVIDASEYSGYNLGAEQRVMFILAGGEYEHRIGKERLYLKALAGSGKANRDWGANAAPGGNASFATFLGGGLDTPLSRQFGLRLEGGFQHTDFALLESTADPAPYRIPGLPNYFSRISAGLTWARHPGPTYEQIEMQRREAPREPVDSEVIFEALGSFGHYHIFASSEWEYFHAGGLEYDRHSWGKFIGARMDYVAEILPIVLLKQPSKTDVFGDPLSTSFQTLGGLGISPVGLRMLWKDDKKWKPYYVIKCGMIGFAQKALSQDGSYENFSLQQSVGIQFKLSNQWDLRAGIGDFHFSNAYLVPADPGIDEMTYNAGLSYHFPKKQARF
jgi:hypothetical protein